MKKTLILIATFGLSFSTMASVSCLRYMGRVDSVHWQKSCRTIIEDHGPQSVREIDGCLVKFNQKGVDYLVFNSDLIKQNGHVQNDVIITKASYKTNVQENANTISATVESASPELFTRYRHQMSFDKNRQQLKISMAKGTFRLSPVYDLLLQCYE